MYQSTPPWDIGRPQPAFAALAEEGRLTGRVLEARFVVGDALELPRLGTTFETVLDCGLFHVFTDEDRVVYVESLSAVVPEGGHYFLLCFNEHQRCELGPHRVTQEEIRSSFAAGWNVESIRASAIELVGGGAAQAWLAVLVRSD